MKNIIELSLSTKTIPIVLAGVDGKALNLRLQEMTAAQRDKHLDSVAGRVSYNEKGEPVGIKKFDGMQADLLVLCLTRADGNGVSREEIQKWPAAVVTEIYEAAQELNHLVKDEKKDAPEKND